MRTGYALTLSGSYRDCWGSDLLRIVDIAEILGVSHQRVHQIYKQGRLPKPARRDEIGPLWERADIEKWAGAEWWGKSRTPWRKKER